MAGEEVGVAFVSLVPSARGFSKLAQKELNAELRGNKTPTINVAPKVDATAARAEITTQLTGLSRQATVQVGVDVDQQVARQQITRSLVTVGDTVRRTQRLDVETDVDPVRLAQQTRAAVAFAETTAGDIDVPIDVNPDRGRILGGLLGRAIGGGIQSAGGSIQAGVTTPLSGLASNPIFGTIGILIGGAIAATLAPALGAAVSAALIGGAGLGAIGLGAFLLRNDPEVRKAAGELGATAKDAFTKAAEPMQQPLVASLNVLRDLVNELRPDLTELFQAISPAVLPLTRGFAGMLRAMMPGLLALVKAATPFLMDLEQTLPRFGKDIGAFFSIIAGGGPQATQFFRDFLHLLGIGLRIFGVLIRVLTTWYGSTRAIVAKAIGIWVFFQAQTGRVFAMVMNAIGRARDFVAGVWRAIRTDTDGFVRFLKGIPRKIVSAVGDLGKLLFESGKKLIQGLIDGIKNKFGALGDVVGSVAEKVRGFWPFSPAKEGPLAGRGGMFYAGQNLVTDLAGGMQHKLPAVESASTQLASALGTGVRGGDGAALAPAGIGVGWRQGATGDQLLDAIRALIEFRFGGDPDAALASR